MTSCIIIFQVVTRDLAKNLERIKDTLDTSNLDPKHPLYTNANQSELFFMKFEMGFHKIIAFSGLGPKMYGMLIQADPAQLQHEMSMAHKDGRRFKAEYDVIPGGFGQNCKLKGVDKSAQKKFGFVNFVNTNISRRTAAVSFNKIVSKGHVLHAKTLHKQALSALDTKRIVLSCNQHTKPYQYHDSAEECGCEQMGY